ncbi:MAG: porin family protein [Parachlamydiaceae bacterium]
MKNMFFLFTALLGMTLSNAATAEEGFYAGVLGGAQWANQSTRHHTKVDYKAGYLVGATLGFTWCNNWSVEGEFAYRHDKVDRVKFRGHHGSADVDVSSISRHHKVHNAHLRSYAVMANARYDFAIDCSFTPYLLGGIGYAKSKYTIKNRHHDSDVSGSHHKKSHCSENGFAYQVGAGFTMPIGYNTTLDVGYRFLGAEKKLYNQSVVFAARYAF